MSYILEEQPIIYMSQKANNAVIEELLQNYTYGTKWNVVYTAEEKVIRIGDCETAECGDADYALCVSDTGVYIEGKDFPGVMHGFMTLLERIIYDENTDGFYIENVKMRDRPLMDFRCAHLCLFPETDFQFFKKCVRSCAIVKYTHIIIEFWGTLKLDCMSELAWPFAHSKEEIREIVKEANALGVEIIPFFNHIGHASGSRGKSGKHVVLDQNPKLEYMFYSYGWIWKFDRKDVAVLHAKIRDELMEVCGAGQYFHIGCDEARLIGQQEDLAAEMAEYINKVAADLKKKGRRCIIWHDMLLSREEFPEYEVNSQKNISDILLSRLDRDVIIADWEYHPHGEIWKTSEKFKQLSFDVVCCPWSSKQNVEEAIQTAIELNLHGIIQTTWHTLYRDYRNMIYAGLASYSHINEEDVAEKIRYYGASVARKAMPANGVYENCGWMDKTTGTGIL